MNASRALGALWTIGVLVACDAGSDDRLPPNSFAFGVFGDGPYNAAEQGEFVDLLGDVGRADLAWLIHVGDIAGGACTDSAYRYRRSQLDGVPHPVIYTPGDNEWTDCRGRSAPLDRLACLRRIFFPDPARSLGARSMSLVSQAADSAFAEFPENARWAHGGWVFATMHVVGSANGGQRFNGRTAANDAEVERRTAAAIAWMDRTFAEARSTGAKGVVLAVHANVGLEQGRRRGRAYGAFVAALERNIADFPNPVLFIHGDSHTQRLDHPLRSRGDGQVYANFARLETFGSPDIGWVRVVIDTVSGRVEYDARRRGWRGWR